jgi:MSHA biogenesis protein MshL
VDHETLGMMDSPMLRCLVLVTLGATWLAGCSSVPYEEISAVESIDNATRPPVSPSAPPTPPTPPPEVSDALLPPIGGAATPPAPSERFGVSVAGVPANTFFMGLVEGTSQNMVVHPDVTGSITLTLKDVQLIEVLETVRDVYGYDFRRTRSGYMILPPRMQSRIFYVSYLDIVRDGQSRTRVSAGREVEMGENTTRQSRAGGRTSSSLSGSDVETTSKSEFWKELESGLNSIVGNGEGRSVVVNRQAGMVVVRAMPEELREVGDYLSELRSALYRQVILEAKILEVILEDGFQSGINWALIGNDGAIGNIGGNGLFGSGTFDIQSDLSGRDINLGGGARDTDLTTSAFGGTFALALDLGDFSAFIELLETQGDVRVLSSPRVSTVNNQKAVIKVGSDEYFITDVDVDRDENGTRRGDPARPPVDHRGHRPDQELHHRRRGPAAAAGVHQGARVGQHRPRGQRSGRGARRPDAGALARHPGGRAGARRTAAVRSLVPAGSAGRDPQRTGHPAASAGGRRERLERRGPASARPVREPRERGQWADQDRLRSSSSAPVKRCTSSTSVYAITPSA